MKIKVGEKLPSSKLFYLDQNNDVKKVDILDLCKDNRIIINGEISNFIEDFIFLERLYLRNNIFDDQWHQ